MVSIYKTYGQQNDDQFNKLILKQLRFANQVKQGGLKYAFEDNLDSLGVIVTGNIFLNGLTPIQKQKMTPPIC